MISTQGTQQLRRDLDRALGQIIGHAREARRHTHWGECTSDAIPLARRDRELKTELPAAARHAGEVAAQPPRKRSESLPEALRDLERVVHETSDVIGGWTFAEEDLGPMEDACLRAVDLGQQLAVARAEAA